MATHLTEPAGNQACLLFSVSRKVSIGFLPHDQARAGELSNALRNKQAGLCSGQGNLATTKALKLSGKLQHLQQKYLDISIDLLQRTLYCTARPTSQN